MQRETRTRLVVVGVSLVALGLGALSIHALRARFASAAKEPAPVKVEVEAPVEKTPLPVLPPPPPATVERPPVVATPEPAPEPEVPDVAMNAINCQSQLMPRIPSTTPQLQDLARVVCAVFSGSTGLDDISLPFTDVGGGSADCRNPLDAIYETPGAFSAFSTRAAARFPVQAPGFVVDGDEARVGGYDFSEGVLPDLSFRFEGGRWKWASQELPHRECEGAADDNQLDPASEPDPGADETVIE